MNERIIKTEYEEENWKKQVRKQIQSSGCSRPKYNRKYMDMLGVDPDLNISILHVLFDYGYKTFRTRNIRKRHPDNLCSNHVVIPIRAMLEIDMITLLREQKNGKFCTYRKNYTVDEFAQLIEYIRSLKDEGDGELGTQTV